MAATEALGVAGVAPNAKPGPDSAVAPAAPSQVDPAPAAVRTRGVARKAGIAGRYGVAAAAIGAALVIKLALVPWVEHDTPFLLFFAAVLVAGWFGGLGPGLLATGLAAAASGFFFMRPFREIRVDEPAQRLRLALFVAEGVFISALAAFLQAARRRAEAATDEARRLERRILETSEQARRHVGHDLHDGLGQQLTGGAFRARRLVQRLEEKGLAEAADARAIEDLLNRSAAWTRDLADGLSPVGLRPDGLPAALEEMADHARQSYGVACTFHGDPSAGAIDATDALHLYHVAQEALENAAVHAKPSLIRLALAGTAERIILSIEDDGAPGAGDLPAVAHRAGLIGATLDVRPRSPRGTAVTCFYPRRTAKRPQK